MPEPLEKLHEVESYLGRDLSIREGDSLIDYLRDNPACTDVRYLIELFDFDGKQAEFAERYRTAGVL